MRITVHRAVDFGCLRNISIDGKESQYYAIRESKAYPWIVRDQKLGVRLGNTAAVREIEFIVRRAIADKAAFEARRA
jgi:hypothetical protein